MISQFLFMVVPLLSSSVSASILCHPPATHISPPQTSIPEPTEPPRFHDLRKRQDLQKTLIAAPDQTCGFFNGSSDQPWGCSTGNCVFVTASPPSSNSTNSTQTATAGSVLCCDPKTGCPLSPAPTACVDKGRNDYNKTCTGSCPDDPSTLKCTSGINIYCNTLTFTTPNITAHFCNYISNYAILRAETTYTGQSNRSFTPTVPVFAVSLTSTSSLSTTSGTGTTSSVVGTPTKTAEGKKGKVDRKAVVGGVLGGLLGLVALVGAGLWWRRWRNTPVVVEEGKGEGSGRGEKGGKGGKK